MLVTRLWHARSEWTITPRWLTFVVNLIIIFPRNQAKNTRFVTALVIIVNNPRCQKASEHCESGQQNMLCKTTQTHHTLYRYHLLLLGRPWVGDRKLERVSGSEGKTTRKQATIYWPQTKLSSKRANSSLSSETHLEHWSVAGQWLICSFV